MDLELQGEAPILACMSFGRLVRVGEHRGDPNAVIYVVAEADAAQAMRLVKAKLERFGGDVEDLGRVSGTLLTALGLHPGDITKT